MTAGIKKNHWYIIRNQSLARYAAYAGFDLSLLEFYSPTVQKELRKRAIHEAIHSIRSEFEDKSGFDLRKIRKGIYVISLSNGMCIQYRNRACDVIYIGIGAIDTRIKQHFEGKLFDFMLDLSGANFDFRFAIPEKSGVSNYHQHIEHLMLEDFQKVYGGFATKRYPLMNKNAGSKKNVNVTETWWRTPLKMTGKKVKWALSPLKTDIVILD